MDSKDDYQIPYGVMAEFDTPAGAMHAAEQVRDAGYVRWDVHTPFPVHGMDEAMGLGNSKVGWFTFCCGLCGFFGGMFSPALFLGGVLGAIVFQLPITSMNSDLLSVLAVSAMASVSSSVIGAPITAIILVLELTGSYEYAIAATFPIVICSFITSRIFANSVFDNSSSTV